MRIISSAWLAIPLALGLGCAGSVESDQDPEGPNPTVDPMGRPNPGALTPGNPMVSGGGGAVMPGVPNPPVVAGKGGAGGGPGPVMPPPTFKGVDGTGPRPLMRLTKAEYANTVRDLFPDVMGVSAAANALPPDAVDGSTGLLVAGNVTGVELDRFLEAAEQIGTAVATKLPGIAGCGAGVVDAPCAKQFAQKFGRRAYRRPLLVAEIDELAAFYTKGRADHMLDHAGGLRLMAQVMLVSPAFLYHWELGRDVPSVEGMTVRLNPHEVAARLSYFLWRTMPDDELFAAADGGKLGNAADLEMQVRRLLGHARAVPAVTDFYSDWLGVHDLETITKNKNKFPDYNAALAKAMEDETKAFVKSVFFDGGDAKLETLLAGNYTFANAALAKFYGIAGITGTAYQKAMYNPAQPRAGLLTHAGFLTREALSYVGSPVKRGKFVREQILCERVPLAPANLNIMPPKDDPTKQTRELYLAHSVDPSCAACHTTMDPLGFAFENYDGVGKYRTEEVGKPVNAAGKVSYGDGKTLEFSNAVDMAKKLVTLEEVRACATKSWLRMALGRFDMESEAGSVAAGQAALQTGNMREMIIALARSKAFLYRTPAQGEVLQ